MMDEDQNYLDLYDASTITFTQNRVKVKLNGETYVNENYYYAGVDEDGWIIFLGEDTNAIYYYISDDNTVIMTDNSSFAILYD